MKKQDLTQKLKAGLYLIATPIGNLGDISYRAVETLKMADLVACEDTRISGKLLNYLGLKKTLVAYHDHSSNKEREKIIEAIENGQSIALLSDAGMPLISDPGYKLVRACVDKDLYITSIPGASSTLMALQLSGLPSDQFCFLGFLSHKSKARRDELTRWKNNSATLILFESATRAQACLNDILQVLGDRNIALARELTKMFEEVWRGKVSELITRAENGAILKGEVVIVIEGASGEIVGYDIDQLLEKALQKSSLKDAVAESTDLTGRAKKEIYARALELQGNTK